MFRAERLPRSLKDTRPLAVSRYTEHEGHFEVCSTPFTSFHCVVTSERRLAVLNGQYHAYARHVGCLVFARCVSPGPHPHPHITPCLHTETVQTSYTKAVKKKSVQPPVNPPSLVPGRPLRGLLVDHLHIIFRT